MTLDVLCIGGANADGDFRLTGPTVVGTSNPATVRYSFGGVARNVAENLARIGCRVGLATAVGSDALGWELIDELASVGVDTRWIRSVPETPTSRYVAIHGNRGEFVIGVNAMTLIDAITPADLTEAPLEEARWVFADTNLSPATLAAIFERRRNAGFRLAIDAVAVPKAARLPERLDGLDVLFANADEANAILGTAEPESPEGGAVLARGLIARGAAAASVSLGEHGAAVASAEGVWHVSVVPVELANTTGTGDARVAGTLLGLLSGAPLQLAARNGSLASALAAESDHAIDTSLTPQRFDAESVRLDAVVVTGPLS